MKIVIFGASGQVGTLLVAEMLKRGHDVSAFIHGPNSFVENKKLKVIRGDVHSQSDIEMAVVGNDAVLSALGSWGTETKDILSSAMNHIVPIMKSHGIKRIVSLTGADARDLGDRLNILQKLTSKFFNIIAGKIITDGEEHIRILRDSNLNWTVLRSPVMTNRGTHGSYRLDMSAAMPWNTISRKDVVTAMADLVEGQQFLQQSPVIYKN